jgi:excisionase family DNA binding protein
VARSGEGLNAILSEDEANDECSSRDADASQRPFDDDLLRKAITLDDPLIPEEEAAHMLRISVRTLQRLRKARRITYVVIARTILFRKSAIERFLQRSTIAER